MHHREGARSESNWCQSRGLQKAMCTHSATSNPSQLVLALQTLIFAPGANFPVFAPTIYTSKKPRSIILSPYVLWNMYKRGPDPKYIQLLFWAAGKGGGARVQPPDL